MKRMYLIVLVLFVCTYSFSKESDSISISLTDYQKIHDKISTLEKENTKLSENISAVNGRISDWYNNLAIGGGVFVFLLGGLIAIQWNNTKGIAKEQAEKELEEVIEKFDSKITEVELMKNDVTKLVQDSKNIVETLREAERIFLTRKRK